MRWKEYYRTRGNHRDTFVIAKTGCFRGRGGDFKKLRIRRRSIITSPYLRECSEVEEFMRCCGMRGEDERETNMIRADKPEFLRFSARNRSGVNQEMGMRCSTRKG